MSNIFELFKQIQSTPSPSSAPVTHILAGLGNPGDKYTFTRHNAGFLALDYISQKLNFKIDRIKFKALCGEITMSEKRVLVMKPQTFMNNSGEAVSEAVSFYKIPKENVIIIQDDIALEPGRMRIRRKGSDGGHNGIKSIIECLGTDSFSRIKLGVGAPPDKNSMINWVLGAIPECEREKFYLCIEKTPAAAEMIVAGDIDGAMGKFNC